MNKTPSKYTPVIGLEVHAELSTKSKMFCGCKNDPFNAPKPNTYTCPVCLGIPGGLPIPNKKAIEWTVQLGLALDCQINLFSKFDRKNYFYPDLPKGYQISQYDIPFCHHGKISTPQGEIRINRIHLEEDTGKLIHDEINGEKVSLIDFNRGGVPLVEIVTEPDIINGEQAKEYGRKLRNIMRYLKIADCKMSEGGMRLEANISLQQSNTQELPNYKVEVKNINSFKFLEQAIKFEIQRQTIILDEGNIPTQETRGWNPDIEKTYSQRIKEDAADYRYFPDPDIPPIQLSSEQINKIRSSLPELPEKIATRWQKEFNLSKNNINQLIVNQKVVRFIDNILKAAQQSNILPNDLANDLVNKKIMVEWKEIVEVDFENSNRQKVIDSILKAHLDFHQTTNIDTTKLESVIKKVLSDHPDAVEKYHNGKKQIIGFLMGQAMQRLTQKPDPSQVRSKIQEVLQSDLS